ncbi:hypothetical protein NL676_039228 [Syzygium grande]|nr:hypothetical protein NL676_039228 [Syzygium grande]
MVLALASKRFENLKISTGRDIFSLLKYREGGVLKRAVHTAASVDLAVLDGLEPMVVLCEVVDDDGSVARLPKLREFAQRENLKIVSIADLIRATLEMVKKGTLGMPHGRHIWIYQIDCNNQLALMMQWLDNGCDTMEANVELGSLVDSRESEIGAQILLP